MIYKLLAKVMANRLKKLLPAIISEEQTGFLPNRSILDRIIIVQEAIHSCQIQGQPNMLLKLDIKKAYDKVDWYFLCRCMKAFGFNKQWINWVYFCISNPRFSILLNGKPEGFFEVSRGLRQGDPLSPFLFIIMSEALGRSLDVSQRSNRLTGIQIIGGVEPCTHQQFVDDSIILGKGQLKEAKEIKNILQSYGLASGEMVNKEKSKIFFFKTKAREEYRIASYLGYKIGHLPVTYLGMHPDKGIKMNKIWDPLIEKVRKKLSSQKVLWLIGAGILTLIKTILAATPIYLLSCIPLPKGTYKKLSQIMRDFYWNGAEDKKK